MADRPLNNPLPADLPEDWTTGQIVAPSGADVGLSEQHGYNYLMEQVNAAQRAVNTINEGFDTISGKRTCRLVVGTSTAGWTQADCDYLCDGTDDQEELSAAIEAVFARGGGEIVVLAGGYDLAGQIEVDDKTGALTVTGEPGAAVFDMSDGIRLYTPSDQELLVCFSGITFRQNASSDAYISAQQVSLAMKNCTLRNVQVQASDFDGPSGFVLQDSLIEASGLYLGSAGFVNVMGAFHKDCLVSGNRFYTETGADSHGVDFVILRMQITGDEDVGKAIVMGNTVSGAGADRTAVELNGNVLAAGNYFSGVDVDVRGIFAGNVVESGHIYAINAGAVSENRISNGYIWAGGDTAVSGNYVKSESTHPAIVAVKIANNSEQDVNPSIVDNYITGGSVGILLQTSSYTLPEVSNALVSGNRIWGCETPIQIESNWSRCMVTNNMFPEGGSVVDKGTDNIVRLNSDDPGGSPGGGTAGVTKFNGRTGAVLPQDGDYTAAMVGAVSSSTAQAIQTVTQAEYDALAVKNPSTLYLIKE